MSFHPPDARPLTKGFPFCWTSGSSQLLFNVNSAAGSSFGHLSCVSLRILSQERLTAGTEGLDTPMVPCPMSLWLAQTPARRAVFASARGLVLWPNIRSVPESSRRSTEKDVYSAAFGRNVPDTSAGQMCHLRPMFFLLVFCLGDLPVDGNVESTDHFENCRLTNIVF